MSYFATVHLAHPDLVLSHTIEVVPEATIRAEYQATADTEARFLFFSVSGADLDRFEEALTEDPTVTDALLIDSFDGHRVYRVRIVTPVRLLTPKGAEIGARVVDVTSGRDGWTMELHVPDQETLVEFRRYARENGIKFALQQLSHATSLSTDYSYGMTDEQRDLLLLAYRTGYFEIPRATSQNELAAEFDISTSAVSHRLRRAIASLIGNTLSYDGSR